MKNSNWKLRLGIFLIIISMPIFIFLSCKTKPELKENNKLIGLWTLHIMEQKDTATGIWNEWRDGMQGYLLYDDNNIMALHLTKKGYENTDLQFPDFTDTIPLEALKKLTQTYYYMAKYSVFEAEQIVEHARISLSNPGEWNKIVKRMYSFYGDTLFFN